jgi:hypothetical protein
MVPPDTPPLGALPRGDEFGSQEWTSTDDFSPFVFRVAPEAVDSYYRFPSFAYLSLNFIFRRGPDPVVRSDSPVSAGGTDADVDTQSDGSRRDSQPAAVRSGSSRRDPFSPPANAVQLSDYSTFCPDEADFPMNPDRTFP